MPLETFSTLSPPILGLGRKHIQWEIAIMVLFILWSRRLSQLHETFRKSVVALQAALFFLELFGLLYCQRNTRLWDFQQPTVNGYLLVSVWSWTCLRLSFRAVNIYIAHIFLWNSREDRCEKYRGLWWKHYISYYNTSLL